MLMEDDDQLTVVDGEECCEKSCKVGTDDVIVLCVVISEDG